MTTIEERLLDFGQKEIIYRDFLYTLIREEYPNYKDSSIRWVIYGLIKKGIISKLNAKQFIIGRANIYHQKNTSEERKEIVIALDERFPNINIVVYESTMLNEWVNHQIARKVIFIESEKYFMNDIFRFLYSEFSTKIMLNPSKEDLYMYGGELNIVTQLISQAPIFKESRNIKIEKLIVDLYTKDLITEFINEDEKYNVVELIFKKYAVNVKTVFAYAKRRNNLDTIKKVISNFTPGELS